MKPMRTFLTGMWRLPVAVRIWLGWLMAVNMIAPLCLLGEVEAQVVLATFFASFSVMLVLTAHAGFTRILGLGHVLWVPLLVFLWSRLVHHPATDTVGLWLRVVVASDTVSLALNAIDVLRFLRGDRAEMVEGLGAACRRV